MKILYIVSSTDIYGGATKSFINMISGVAAAGNEVVVVLPASDGLTGILKGKGIRTYVFKYGFDIWPKIRFGKGLLLYLPRLIRRFATNNKAVSELVRIVEEEQPDLIHTNVSPITIGYKASKKCGVPHVLHIREYGDKDFNLNIRNVSELIKESNTISITKDIAAYRGVLGKPGHTVIYNGIFHESEFKYREGKEPFFLYAGRITEKKGIGLLIDGYIRYIKKYGGSYGLQIAGRVPDPKSQELVNSLKAELERSGISDKVHWLGEIKDLSGYMQKTAATIVPSYFEGFGRVMAEACFNGSLVVGYDSAGTKEQFDNGIEITGNEIGLRFNDAEELGRQLIKVECHEIPVGLFVERAQETSKRLYTIETNVEHVIGFYKSILNDEW